MELIDAVEKEIFILEASQGGLGCYNCPSGKKPGVKKILGSVTGKKVFLWVQSPGAAENREGRELVGKAGQLLWGELARVGITRDDCDIQNVMRCFPAIFNPFDASLEMRDPDPKELKCCSVYNKIAIEDAKAELWLVFGQIAATQLFGKKKHPPIFFHHGIKVFVLDHPAYFLRGAPPERLKKFRETLDVAGHDFKSDKGRFSFLYTRKYIGIYTGSDAIKAATIILTKAEKTKSRVVYDVETDVIDGTEVLLCIGVSIEPGISYVFVLDHPENQTPQKERKIIREVLKRLVEHPHEKAMHHGNSDAEDFLKLLGAEVKGFHYDTQYGAYMADSSDRSFKLSAITDRMYPQFAGYKEIVQAAVPEGMSVEDGKDIGEFHLSQVSLETLIVYNGADCDVTKQVELDTKDRVPVPLVGVYTDAAFILDEMVPFGPLFDQQQYNRMIAIYPKEKDRLADRFRLLAEDPDINLNSPPQLAKLIYDKWRCIPVSEKLARSTEKETLQLIQDQHAGIKILMDYRFLKTKVERLEAFERSALAHLGRITTYWWLTGARTGRLSSGGGSRPDKRNLGNLQNIPRKDFHLKNILISDLRWREFYNRVKKVSKVRVNSEGKKFLVCPTMDDLIQEFSDLEWFISSDYSQMELRILAQVTGDPEMVRVFCSGEDIHAAIGALWTGWSKEEIKEDDTKRAIVKGFHFGVIYGLTPGGLKQDLEAEGVNITKGQAQKYYDSYFARMRLVKKFTEDMPKFAMQHGYVENLFGFRTPIDVPGHNNQRYSGKAWWENQTVNSPIQGGAHQVLLIALALLKRFRSKYALIRPQMEIHDSLVTISQTQNIEETIKVTKILMEKEAPETATREFGINWKIPFQVEAKIGLRFGGLVTFKGSLAETISNVILKIDEQQEALVQVEKDYA